MDQPNENWNNESTAALAAEIGPHDVVAELRIMGSQIQRSFQGVLQSLRCEQPVRPQRLATYLGLQKNFSSRLLMAVGQNNPLAVVHSLPGPLPLRKFLEVAEARGAAESAITLARQTVHALEQFLDENFEERRGELDSLLGESLSEARESAESAAKQTMFRGAVGITGITCEAALSVAAFHPSANDPDRYDVLAIEGGVGLRRLRSDTIIRFMRGLQEQSLGEDRNIKIKDVSERQVDPGLVRPFCYPENIPITISQHPMGIRYEVNDNGFGRRSAVNIAVSSFLPGLYQRSTTPDKPQLSGVSMTLDKPARRLVADYLLHPDVWPGRRPDLRLYDTTVQGVCNANDPRFDERRLRLSESVEFIGKGTSCMHHTSLPRYVESLEALFAQRGWDPDSFNVWRCEILYPVYGSQVCINWKADA